MATYSFLSVQGAFTGPGGAFVLGSSAGIAEEGITSSMVEEKDLATVGADGALMHTLRASNLGKFAVRCLKTSALNAQLMAAYNFQKSNPALWGQNVLTVADVNRGDFSSLTQAAFVKKADVTWDKDGKMNEWEFLGILEETLGTGVPDVNV